MNASQKTAYECLGETGWVVDPKYAYNKHRQEEKLKADCKRCWKLRQDFPEWVKKYVSRWSEAAKPEMAGDQRIPNQDLERDVR